MQQIGDVRFKVNGRGYLEELWIEKKINGKTTYIPLDRERRQINAKVNPYATNVVSIELVGNQYVTGHTTIPGRRQYSQRDLELVNQTLLQRLKGTGRQKTVIIF